VNLSYNKSVKFFLIKTLANPTISKKEYDWNLGEPPGILTNSLIRQEKGVKHAKIYAIDLRTKIPYLPTEQTRI
jgi:spore germination protein YaaH